MTEIGLMIEGQDGLNWPRWKRLLQAAEDFGFAYVFRSDHYTNAAEMKDSLELFVSLTYAASHTKRIGFGSMVAPTTFRQPALTVRMAAQIDDLSGGRLTLGLGAGWNEPEHKRFGIPFFDVPTRHAMFAEALEITKLLLESDAPVSYQGAHYSLDDAVMLPRPQRKMPILIGGNGMTKTLPLAAKYGDEWNGVYINPDAFRERATRLAELLHAEGRDANSVKRSLMTRCTLHRSDADIPNESPESATARGIIIGKPSQIVDQIGMFVDAGVERFMLQWLEQDDIDGLEVLARDVLPHFHTP